MEEKGQKRFSAGKLILWICLFPVMLLIVTIRTGKIHPGLKAFLLALQLGLWGTAGFLGYRYIFSDRQPPVIWPLGLEAGYGTEISVRDLASITDNKDKDPVLTIENCNSGDGEIRAGGSVIVFGRAGEFTVTVSGTDASGNRTIMDIPVSVKDNVPPEIALQEAEAFSVRNEIPVSKIASARDEMDPAPSLKIIAVSDGGKISKDGETVSFDHQGTYTIGLLSVDASGNTAKNTVSVIVRNDIFPELILSEKEIQIDESVKAIAFEDYAEARSEVYGDLKNRIVIDDSQVIFGKPGTYMVTYTVEDEDHHKAADQLRVVIMDTTAPEIYLSRVLIDYTTGEAKPDYMEGVRAEDANDGDLTDKVIVDSLGVDYQNPGRYEVIYTAADQAGNKAEETAIVSVTEEDGERTAVIDEFETSRGHTSEGEDDEQVMDYVLNTNTRRFHYPYCSSVSTIKDKNREDFKGTREKLIERHFKPCGKCNP